MFVAIAGTMALVLLSMHKDLTRQHAWVSELSTKDVESWVFLVWSKLIQKPVMYQSVDWHEILCYVTHEDICQHRVCAKSEVRYLADHFQTDPTPVDALPDPAQTFGQDIKGETCPKCKCTNTFSMAKQDRSMDEATSIHFFCLNPKCKHRWKHRG